MERSDTEIVARIYIRFVSQEQFGGGFVSCPRGDVKGGLVFLVGERKSGADVRIGFVLEEKLQNAFFGFRRRLGTGHRSGNRIGGRIDSKLPDRSAWYALSHAWHARIWQPANV